MFNNEDFIDAECAWEILNEIEKLQNLLLQRYHYELMEINQKMEHAENSENLPF